jgi:predicted HicB family RNase H-like nuclease
MPEGEVSKKLLIDIEDSLHKKLRVKAAQEDKTMKDLIIEAIEELVKK